MPSSGILRRVALVRTDVSEERIGSIFRVTSIDELGTSAVTSHRSRGQIKANSTVYLGSPHRCYPNLIVVVVELSVPETLRAMPAVG
jgi:hypothetical protein